MSRADSFGFTHLVEDADTENMAGDPDKSYPDLELQPHLSNYTYNNEYTSRDFGVNENWQQPTFQGLKKTDEQLEKEVYLDRSSVLAVESRTNISNNTAYSETSLKTSIKSPEHARSISHPVEEQSVVHVQYSATGGKVNVLQGQVRTTSDGSHSIDTQGIQELWSESERPLHQRRIKCLKILSILACIAFFPFGTLAVYFAFRTETEFSEGIMRGNIDRALKFAKRAEGLIIISFIMCLVVVALASVAIVQSNNSRSVPKGPIMG